MDFEVVGDITRIEVIAVASRIRGIRELQKRYGKGRWRKLKGIALIQIRGTGEIRKAELHWYEAHGIGRRRVKIKRFLD